jgi:hypothetical protein
VVDHLSPHEPEVEDVDAAVGRTLGRGGCHRRRGEPHVASDRDRARLEDLGVRATDPVRPVLVELRAVQPADVVRLEDGGVEHVEGF